MSRDDDAKLLDSKGRKEQYHNSELIFS